MLLLTLGCEEEQVVSTKRPPALTLPESPQVREGETLTLHVDAVDPDDEPLTLTAEGLPDGAAFDPGSANLVWTPSFAQGRPDTYAVTFTADNGRSATVGVARIGVLDVNRPPALALPGEQTVNERDKLSLRISATDPDKEDRVTITPAAQDMPQGAQFDPDTNTLTWVPDYGQEGLYSITFTAADDHELSPSLSVQGTIAIRVLHSERVPSALMSTVAVEPATVPADGVNAATIVVTVRDKDGVLLPGLKVTLTATGRARENFFVQPASETDSDGVATGMLSSTRAEEKTITALVNDSLSLVERPTVVFVPTAPASATLTAIPPELVADGEALTTLALTILDAQQNPVPALEALVEATGSENAFEPDVLWRTDEDGRVVWKLRSTRAEGKVVTASAGGLEALVVVNFQPGLPEQLVFTTPPRVFAAESCAGARAVITVEAQDAQGNTALAGAGGLGLTAASTGANGAWYTDEACSDPAAGGAFTIPAGSRQVHLYYQDADTGPVTVSLQSALAVPAPQAHTVGTGKPAALRYTTPVTYTVGLAIAPNKPASEGGAPESYSIAPALPAGLALAPSTGVISGTPTAVTSGFATHTVTATNSAGSTTFDLSIKVIPRLTLAAISPAVHGACGGTDLALTGTNLTTASKLVFTSAQSEVSTTPVEAPVAQKSGKFVATLPALPVGGFYHVLLQSTEDPANRSELPSGLLAMPEITGSSPGQVAYNEILTFTGCGLQGASNAHSVWLPMALGGLRPGVATSSTSTSSAVKLFISGFNSGVAQFIGAGWIASAPWPVTVTGTIPVLSIASVTQSTGGKAVVAGHGFDAAVAANNKVRFWVRPSPSDAASQQEVEPIATGLTATSLTVFVPASAVTGPVEVRVGGATAVSPRAYVVAGTNAVPSVLGVSHPWPLTAWRTGASASVNNALRTAIFGSGFGTDAGALTVTATAGDRVARQAPVYWASDQAILADLPADLPLGGATVEVKRNGSLVGQALVARRRSSAAFAYNGPLPSPVGGGPEGATLYVLGGNVATVHGALLFIDTNQVRIYNQKGERTNFYGKTVGAGKVETIYPYSGTAILSIAVAPGSGDLYLGVSGALRRLDFDTGDVTTLISGSGAQNNGPLTDATVVAVRTIAFVPGNPDLVYLLDSDNGNLGLRLANFGTSSVTIHGVTVEAGYIRTIVAGSASSGLTISRLPGGMAVGPGGDLYYLIYYGQCQVRLRRTDGSTEEITRLTAGLLQPPVGENVKASVSPSTLGGNCRSLGFGPDGSLYVGTTVGTVRRLRPNPTTGIVDKDSLMDTVAGAPAGLPRAWGFAGDGDAATSALLGREVFTLGLDANSDLLVGASGCRLRTVSAATGKISTLLGSGCYVAPEGKATNLTGSPRQLFVDTSSDVLYTTSPGRGSELIWRIDPSGDARTVGEIDDAYALALVGGKLYAAESLTGRVYRVDPQTGAKTLVAGGGSALNANGAFLSTGDGGAATAAGIKVDGGYYNLFPRMIEGASDLVVISEYTTVVRAFNPTDHTVTAYGRTFAPGMIDRIAGGGTGYTEGAGARTQAFSNILWLARHPSGDLLIVDRYIAPGVYRLSRVDGTLRTVVGPPRGTAAPVGLPPLGRGVGTFRTALLAAAADRFGNVYFTTDAGSVCRLNMVLAAPDGEIYPDSPVFTDVASECFAWLGASSLFQFGVRKYTGLP